MRIYPSLRQSKQLEFVLDTTLCLYNALLEQRREAYRRRGVTVTTQQQYRELTQLRASDCATGRQLRSIYRECLDGALHRLDKAYRMFFRRLAAGECPGFPRYKSPRRWRQIEYCHGNRALKLDADQRYLFIPGIGPMRLRRGRRIGEYGRAWIVLHNERWYACFECERPLTQAPAGLHMVGIDRGVRVLAATSAGKKIANPRFAANDIRVGLHSRSVSSLTLCGTDGKAANRGDRQRKKAVMRLRRAHERQRNARRDYLHKASRQLVNGYAVLVLEALNVRSMTRSARGTADAPGRHVRAKAGLNKAILDSGFTIFRSMIIAKAEEAGRTVIEVNPKYTSQTCSNCFQRDARYRKQGRFQCGNCGYTDDADVNAAKVILARAQSALKSKPNPGEESGRDGKRRLGSHDEDTELVKVTKDADSGESAS